MEKEGLRESRLVLEGSLLGERGGRRALSMPMELAKPGVPMREGFEKIFILELSFFVEGAEDGAESCWCITEGMGGMGIGAVCCDCCW